MYFRIRTNRFFHVWRGAGVAALLLGMGGVPAWALSIHWGTDTFYARNSADLNLEQRGKLESLRCKVGTRAVDSVVVVGHASNDESGADTLSLQRAKLVVQWFESHTSWKTYIENKGATQPVANNQEAGGRSKNRRVEIEPIITNPFVGEALAEDCKPAWTTALFASPSTAPSVAGSLVLGGDFAADVPFLTALNGGRLDIFDALVAHADISLSEEQRDRVALRALAQGRTGYFLDWVKHDALRLLPRDGDLLLRRACYSGAKTPDRVRAMDALTGAGARVSSAETMGCIVGYTQKPVEVLDALVRAGGLAYVTPDIVVASGSDTLMLNRLMELGLSPNAHNAQGATLFHTMKLSSISDVQRLLNWGLDINALAIPKYNGDLPTTPMYEALPYASVEVLEYMKLHGARIEGREPYEKAHNNAEVQRWMVENAIPIGADEVVDIAKNSVKPLAVFDAMRRHGVDFNEKSSSGESTLAVAITKYNVDLVALLVDAGIGLGPLHAWPDNTASTALQLARNLSAQIPPPGCIGPCPKSHPGPTPSADLEQRKRAIISILENALRER